MTRRALPFLLLGLCLFGQKKPITLEALNAPRSGRDMGMALWSPDGKSFLYAQAGKVHLYDVAAKTSRELYAVNSFAASAVKVPPAERFTWENRGVREQMTQWSPDGRRLLISSGGDLFLWNLQAGGFDQLTRTNIAERDPKLSPDGRKVAFRREHDLYVLDLDSRKETRLTKDGSETLLNGELDWVYPEELALDTAYWWSPDSTRIAYLQFDVSREPLYPHADLLGKKAIYEPERYPQAGDPNAHIRLGVIPAAGGNTTWMDIGDTQDRYLIARVDWMPGGKRLAVQRTTRVQNRLDLLAFDAVTGESSLLLRENDPAWVNVNDDLSFLEDGRRFLWTSERTGYRHLYLYGAGEPKQLTSGDWEIKNIAGVDEAKGVVYYLSGEPHPLESHLYSVRLDGTGKQRITTAPGTHMVSLAPNRAVFIDSYSSLQSPPRRILADVTGRELAVLTEADRKQSEEYDILPVEIVTVKAADGKTDMFARLIRPAGFQPGRKYPVVVQVYGGPHAQSVRNAWSGVTQDQVLAHKGFVVWQVDNRGSWGRGHWYETPVHRKLGVVELADQKAGVAHLISMGFAEPKRIGVNGWSYGGFMTLNCLLNAPDVFTAGIAGAPVTNFANYDSIYTERYMGLPSENPEGYAVTDLTKSAKNLKGKLMLVHNTDDDNVLFQNLLQMTNALQVAGKRFELMLYPQKSHGVGGPAARQMRDSMMDFFERTLLSSAETRNSGTPSSTAE